MAKKRTKPVEVPADAHEGLKDLSERTGISQKVIVSSVLTWLSLQHPDIQGAIIGYLPISRRPEFAMLILHSMAKKKKDTKDAGVNMMRLLEQIAELPEGPPEDKSRVAAKRLAGPKHGKSIKSPAKKKPTKDG